METCLKTVPIAVTGLIFICTKMCVCIAQCFQLTHLSPPKPTQVGVLLTFCLPFWLLACLNEVFRVLNVTKLL